METTHFSQGSIHPELIKGNLRIYSMRFCPFAQRSLLVLAAKNIPCDVVNVDLTKKPEWFLEINPRGQVPALEFENGTVLPESLIVSDYLDEVFKNNPLHPVDPLKRALDRVLVERFNGVITPMFQLFSAFGKPEKDFSPFTTMLNALDLFEKELASRKSKFFGGKLPGMLDYMVWPWFERMEVLPIMGGEKLAIPKNQLEKLMQWCEDMKQEDAVKKWILHPKVHVHYLETRLTGKPVYDFLV